MSAAGSVAGTFTPEQRAAIDARQGSSLLAAGAGSGKTAVLVERFVAGVLEDRVAVGQILCLTFTEKAAAQLRSRIRSRFSELGADEQARSVDAAWIGTIHGFCTRILRAAPLAAGLDPHFSVLDEAAAQRLSSNAFEHALERWTEQHGSAALDVAAAYRWDIEANIVGAHSALRSRGATRPSLPLPPDRGRPDPTRLRNAAADAGRALHTAPTDGARVSAGLDAIENCERLTSGGEVPTPTALVAAKLPSGAKALDHPACGAYREAFADYRLACADFHARPTLVQFAALLEGFAAAYAELKAQRAALDFDDLELRTRDLLAQRAVRERWAERYELIMIDEFQDTNRLQLDILEALERDNMFAVGDESQSIYGFRHADVSIFRARRDALDARGLTVNFRSRKEILDVVNRAFAPLLGSGFTPLVAGRVQQPAADGELRLFEPDGGPQEPRVELVLTSTDGWREREAELGLQRLAAQPWRRAEARAVAARLRGAVDAGYAQREVVVLVRATTSLRLYEQALEEQGLATYVIGGRGYWAQEQVRDGIAYLSLLANRFDEAALYATLASPFCGVGSDALILLADAGRAERAAARRARDESPGACGEERDAAAPATVTPFDAGADAPDRVQPIEVAGAFSALMRCTGETRPGWLLELDPQDVARLVRFANLIAGEQRHAQRRSLEVLLERAVSATGYDLAILGRTGGDRRLANLRKLMRLAREYERVEGRDLRGFLDFVTAQDLAETREGEAALESEGLDAVRLMTIHRAKGLEFPVVCVADLGRPGQSGRERLIVGERSAGLRLVTLAGGDPVPTSDFEAIAAVRKDAEAQEERRLLYVAATRARERLIVSGGLDIGRWPEPRGAAAPIRWLAPALLGDGGHLEAFDPAIDGSGAVKLRLNTPENLPADHAAPPGHRRVAGDGPRERVAPDALRHDLTQPAIPHSDVAAGRQNGRPELAPRRLSYSALRRYAECGYRYYLERELRMGRVKPPPAGPGQPDAADPEALDPKLRGALAHKLLEGLDFTVPRAPTVAEVLTIGPSLVPEQVEDLRSIVAAFARSPLCARLTRARTIRREAGFAFALENGQLLSGALDLLAHERDGTLLIIDYKSDRLMPELDPEFYIDDHYRIQRLVYALAGLSSGADRVEVAYALLDRPDTPISRIFTHADRPILAAQLTDLAADLAGGRREVSAHPNRELCADCPGRETLCSHPQEVTLAKLPR